MLAPWRPEPKYPVYPPYHTGPYLEDYLFEKFSEGIDGWLYIPVSWTTCHIDGCPDGLQDILSSLPEGRYFTICQHDDGVKYQLPNGTKKFYCSHADEDSIDIPLVASPIPKELIPHNERIYLASFVGSITHPVRYEMLKYIDHRVMFVKAKRWSPSVNDDELKYFIDISTRSKFMLCPRGYGLSSFRVSEAFQLGCVPVIISDNPGFMYPIETCVEIIPEDLPDLVNILQSFSDHQISEMRHNGAQYFKKHMTFDGVYDTIRSQL